MSQATYLPPPVGVHLVGSVPLPTATDVFLRAAQTLPNRLLRIPDGETGHRQNFTLWQRDILKSMPQMLRQLNGQSNAVPTPLPTASELASVVDWFERNPALSTHYDDYALESYAIFTSLRSSGGIPKNTKFQVSLPTPLNVLPLVADGYQATVEPYYEQALARTVKSLEASIPSTDLAVQWDVASEFAMLEGITWPFFAPFFSPVKEGIIERLIRLADLVDPKVECGFHLCYGDRGHRHFVEPKDMSNLVEIAAAILKGAKREITWFHMPVPKDRTDDEYFKPLESLDLGKTQLYLGVVHFDDLEGTKQRIKSAMATNKKFGVGTECGMGRTPPEHLDSILDISRKVTVAHW
jgi:hypothetical protein